MRSLREIQDALQENAHWFYIHDLNGKFLWVNKSLAKALGYTADELKGKSHKDFVKDTNEQKLIEDNLAQMNFVDPFRLTVLKNTKKNSSKTETIKLMVLPTLQEVTDDDEKPISVIIGVCLTKFSLIQNWKKAFDALPYPVLITDKNLKYKYSNNEYKSITGLEDHKLKKDGWIEHTQKLRFKSFIVKREQPEGDKFKIKSKSDATHFLLKYSNINLEEGDSLLIALTPWKRSSPYLNDFHLANSSFKKVTLKILATAAGGKLLSENIIKACSEEICDGASVWMFDEDQKILTLFASNAIGDESDYGSSAIPLNHSKIFSKVIKGNNIELIPDLRDFYREKKEQAPWENIFKAAENGLPIYPLRKLAVLPIRSAKDDKVLGLLVLHGLKHFDLLFTADNRTEILMPLQESIGLAFEIGRKERIVRVVSQLTKLNSQVHQLSQYQFLKKISQAIHTAIPCQETAIFLKNKFTDELELAYCTKAENSAKVAEIKSAAISSVQLKQLSIKFKDKKDFQLIEYKTPVNCCSCMEKMGCNQFQSIIAVSMSKPGDENELMGLIRCATKKNEGQDHKLFHHLDLVLLSKIREHVQDAISNYQLVQEKDEFLRDIDHTRRQPLSVCITASNILKSSFERITKSNEFANIPQDIRQTIASMSKYLRQINRGIELSEYYSESTRYFTIISNLGENKFNLKPRPLEIISMLQELVDLFNFKSQVERDIGIDFPHHDPIIIFADERSLRVAIMNLLDNAVKYSVGEDDINVHCTKSADRFYLRVTNTSYQIPQEMRDKIFDKYGRIWRPEVDYIIPGSGIGLFLALRIARAHHGEIRLKPQKLYSEGKRGEWETTFEIELPLSTRGK